MADKTETKPGAGGEQKVVVTEADLLKSIQDLETKTETKPGATEPVKEPVIEVAPLVKSAADILKEKGSAELKKALDVSEILREVTGLLGNHVDTSLEAMAKSLQGGAERDLAIVKVLTDLKKSIDDNTAAIKAYGEQPGGRVTSSPTTPGKADILHKSLPGATEKQLDPATAKRQVTMGLEKLAKSFPPGDAQAQPYISAAITFESTGKISDHMLAEAKAAMTPKA